MTPFRRPSAAAALSHQPSSIPSVPSMPSARSHKNHESQHAFGESHSVTSLDVPLPAHQRNVQVLVDRLRNKLPCYCGASLDVVESEDAVQQIIDALVNLAGDSLDTIAYQLAHHMDKLLGDQTLANLQSQLFLLKVLSACMAFRWSHPPRNNPRNPSFATTPDSPAMSGHKPSSGKTRSEAFTPSPWPDPVPLEERTARYVLSIMVMLLRNIQADTPSSIPARKYTDPAFRDDVFGDPDLAEVASDVVYSRGQKGNNRLKNRASANSMHSSATSFTSSIPGPAGTASYEKTSMSLIKSPSAVNAMIAKYAGRVIFHVSASNWSVVLARLQAKIRQLTSHNAGGAADMADLHVLSYSYLDKPKLILIFNELTSVLVDMDYQTLMFIANPIRIAVWNWIDLHPSEFNDCIRHRGRLEGAPERIFDLFHKKAQSGSERSIWPTLTVLACISSDRLTSSSGKSQKSVKFGDEVAKALPQKGRLAGLALECALEICRAATHVEPENDIPLRMLAFDLAHDIKANCMGVPPNRSFWDMPEIDVLVYTEALVSIYRFLPPADSTPVFKLWLEPDKSEAVKGVVINACLELIAEAQRFPWVEPLETLEKKLRVPVMETYNATAGVRRTDYARLLSTKPRARRDQSALTDREQLLLAVIQLACVRPAFFMQEMDLEDVRKWLKMSLNLWETNIDPSIKVALAKNCYIVAEVAFSASASSSVDPEFVPLMVKCAQLVLPTNLMSIAKNLLHSRSNIEDQRLWTSVSLRILELYIRPVEHAHVREIQEDHQRIPAFRVLEIALGVTLSSPDNSVSHLAAQALRLIAHTERHVQSKETAVLEKNWPKRHLFYEQLGDPRTVIVGRVEYQKRVRKALRAICSDSAGSVNLWQEWYYRWLETNQAFEAANADEEDNVTVRSQGSDEFQEARSTWHNLTLLLAMMSNVALGGAADTDAAKLGIPLDLMPDQFRVFRPPEPMLFRYMKEMIGHLMSKDSLRRDVAREALGTELHYLLYPKLFEEIHMELEQLSKQKVANSGSFLAGFIEQVCAVMRLIVDNPHVQSEEVISFDVNSTLQTLCICTDALHVTPEALRLRIKFCGVAESLCTKQCALTMGRDSATRGIILEKLMEWQIPVAKVKADCKRVQSELNLACLKAIVWLLDRLEIKAPEDTTGTDHLHDISRIFGRYSAALLSGLTLCQPDIAKTETASDLSNPFKPQVHRQEAELRELVIAGLSHLVVANSECGFKECLPLAYGKDASKRSIFAHVFARVIGQGTKFIAEDRVIPVVKHDRLSELVQQPDLSLALAICEICPAPELDGMITVLLSVFDNRHAILALIKALIDKEIAATSDQSAFFRSNSTCTSFLAAFARIHGYEYLQRLVKPLLAAMENAPAGFEMNPARAVGEDVDENRRSVEYVAQAFLQIITSSVPILPSMFRDICRHITARIIEVWPEAKFPSLGAFMFLRFISPAVCSPEKIDLETPTDETRRGLMLIAKVVQNLANNMFFMKETHMKPLNPFMQANISSVTRFLSDVIRKGDDEAPNDRWTGTTSDDTDFLVLHRFFHKHADGIGKVLLSSTRRITETDPTGVGGKRAWDGLCTLLVDLGPPVDPPKWSTQDFTDNQEFRQLAIRYKDKPEDTVQKIFLEVPNVPRTDNALFVLRLSALDVETVDIEHLLFYIIMRVLETGTDRLYDCIIDCTGFTSDSEIPLRYLKRCAELIPRDIRTRLSTAAYLNPNFLTQKYLRRVYNVAAGIPVVCDIRVCPSIADLIEQLPTAVHAQQSLLGTAELENEECESYHDVTMKHGNMRPGVTMMVGTTHIRLISNGKHALWANVDCRAVEVIPFTDITDIYKVSTSADLANEFIIRKNKTGTTTYFTSPEREEIIKAVRTAKGKIKDPRTPLSDRFSRFSNVPATLLHVGLLNLDPHNEELCTAAYDLLGAICTYLNYAKSPIVAARAGFVPGEFGLFAAQLSERIANFAPQLTLDFISEVSAAMPALDNSESISCLRYLSPWIKNLALFLDPTSLLYEKSVSRMRDCIRVLSEMTLAFPMLHPCIYEYVWAEVAKLETAALDVVLDELVRSATDAGVGTPRCENIVHMIASFSSISIRGRLMSRLRKAIVKAAPTMGRSFTESSSWNEVSTLLRVNLIGGFDSKTPSHNQLYVPEIVHVVTLVAALGSTFVRKTLYGIVINLLQSLYQARADEAHPTEIRRLLDNFMHEDVLHLFGLARCTPTSEYTSTDTFNDRIAIQNQETLTGMLCDVLAASAGTTGLLNVWRARWMSLATATAFQFSSTVQMRAFTALGCLGTADVDDDFFYQMLVALNTAMARMSDGETLPIVSMLRSISKIVPAVRGQSRFLPTMFWVAVALLQSSHFAFYLEAGRLMFTIVDKMEREGMFANDLMSTVLMEARRDTMDDMSSQLDRSVNLSFDANFSLALVPVIFKGIRHEGLKACTKTILQTLLTVSGAAWRRCVANGTQSDNYVGSVPSDALGYFLALLPYSTTPSAFRELLDLAQVDPVWIDQSARKGVWDDENWVPRVPLSMLGPLDLDMSLFATSFVGGMISSSHAPDVETEMLFGLLSEMSSKHPEVVSLVYYICATTVENCFRDSTNSTLIRYASEVLRISTAFYPPQESPNPALVSKGSVTTLGSTATDDTSIESGKRRLGAALDVLGMGGLAVKDTYMFNIEQGRTVIKWIPEHLFPLAL